MHFGVPVVPEEYMMNSGWLKGTCSNFSCDPPNPFVKSSNITLWVCGEWEGGGQEINVGPCSACAENYSNHPHQFGIPEISIF